MTGTTDFPTIGVELRYLLVASDFARALAFYRDVLGAKVVRQISDVFCLLSFGGSEVLLTVGGGPTRGKPTVTFAPPIDPNTVSSELNIHVPDCVLLTRYCARAEPNFSRLRSIRVTKCVPSCAIPMVISLS